MRHFLRKCGIPIPSTSVAVGPLDDGPAGETVAKDGSWWSKQTIPNMIPNKNTEKTQNKSTESLTKKPTQPVGKLIGECGNKTARFNKVMQFVIEDWLFLALLGIIMALFSLGMDSTIEFLQNCHVRTIDFTNDNTYGFTNFIATFTVWSSYAVSLILLSALFVHYVAPQAIGSGIPEMKTILRGVILKEYLTFRTLVAKMVGLTLSLGSGLPIGKEGPFVHIASIVANLLSYLIHSFNGIYANESRSSEMLAAACAVGVSSTFSAPIGGVLFSIEVTSVYFAVRNYWRGFFAAACSATVFRLLRVFLNESEVTVIAFYQTNFPREAFFPEELPVFALIGIICGFLAAAFILIQRKMVLFLRKNKWAKSIFQKHWIIYPIAIALLVATITYPNGFGKFLAGERKFSQTAQNFFHNCTWTALPNSSRYCGADFLYVWTGLGNGHSIFLNLFCFIGVYFFVIPLSSTLPIPSGIFGPTFVYGAAIGRTVGEMMAVWYPLGIRGPNDLQIYPGIYAVVGAAAFCGGVTHTISVAVIVFELTGQLLYLLPVMISVLIANAISSYLQPSIYDSIIKIKHLPYLPDIPQSSSNFHGIRVEQFMSGNVKFLSKCSTYLDAQNLIMLYPHLKAFPVVDNKQNMILIGSCSRTRLIRSLELRVGQSARQAEANRRLKNAIENQFEIVEQKRASIISIGQANSLFSDAQMKGSSSDSRLSDVIQKNSITIDENNQQKAEKKFSVDSMPDKTPKPECSSSALVVETSPSRSRTHSNIQISMALPAKAANSSTHLLPLSPTQENTQYSHHSSGFRNRSLTAPSLPSNDVYSTIGGMIRTLTSFGRIRKNNYDNENDLHGDERREWENIRLMIPIDFEDLGVDAAPFQLVEHSSLFKVHSLFSLLGLNRAYVTKCGRLVGVVSLRDLRVAVEKIQNGQITADSPPLWSYTHSELNVENGIITDENQPLTLNSSDDEEDEEDVKNDILTPRLEVISRKSTVYGGADYDVESRKDGRRASEVMAGAANLLAQSAIATNPDLANVLKKKTDKLKSKDFCSSIKFYQDFPADLETSKNFAIPKSDETFTPGVVFSITEIPEVIVTPAPDPASRKNSDNLFQLQDNKPVNEELIRTSSPAKLRPLSIVRSKSDLTKDTFGHKVESSPRSSLKKSPSWLNSSKNEERRVRHVQILMPETLDSSALEMPTKTKRSVSFEENRLDTTRLSPKAPES